jgi:hypothetical protein
VDVVRDTPSFTRTVILPNHSTQSTVTLSVGTRGTHLNCCTVAFVVTITTFAASNQSELLDGIGAHVDPVGQLKYVRYIVIMWMYYAC